MVSLIVNIPDRPYAIKVNVDGLSQLSAIVNHPDVVYRIAGTECVLCVGTMPYTGDDLVCGFAIRAAQRGSVSRPPMSIVRKWNIYTFRVCSRDFKLELRLGMTGPDLQEAVLERFAFTTDFHFVSPEVTAPDFVLSLSRSDRFDIETAPPVCQRLLLENQSSGERLTEEFGLDATVSDLIKRMEERRSGEYSFFQGDIPVFEDPTKRLGDCPLRHGPIQLREAPGPGRTVQPPASTTLRTVVLPNGDVHEIPCRTTDEALRFALTRFSPSPARRHGIFDSSYRPIDGDLPPDAQDIFVAEVLEVAVCRRAPPWSIVGRQ
jgi:hypothetical protein